MTKHRNTKGFRRIFTRDYIIIKSQVHVSGTKQNSNLKPSGAFTINSQFLKDYVRRKARVIVYVPRSSLTRGYKK